MRSREIILDAAREVIGEAGFDGVHIAGVAKRAGVSRQTVYSIFRSRENLVSLAVTERLAGVAGTFTAHIANSDSALEMFVEMLLEARRQVRGDPLLRTLALSGNSNPIFDPGASERAQEFTAALLTPAVDRFPELAGRIDHLSDIAVHVGWSVLCLDDPDARSDEDLRRFLTAWMTPVFAAHTA